MVHFFFIELILNLVIFTQYPRFHKNGEYLKCHHFFLIKINLNSCARALKNGFYKIENPHNCGNSNYQNPIKLPLTLFVQKQKSDIFQRLNITLLH